MARLFRDQLEQDVLQVAAFKDARRKALVDQLNKNVAQIADDNGRRLAEGFAKEIASEVNEDAISRLASFERLADDAKLSVEQKVALAVSGWLVGANQATDKFQTAISQLPAPGSMTVRPGPTRRAISGPKRSSTLRSVRVG